MQKKVIVLAMSFFLVLVLAGCGKKSNDDQKTNSQVQKKSQETQSEEKQNKEFLAGASEACIDKNEGESCEVIAPQGDEKKTGTCRKNPQSEQLVCLPEGVASKERPGLSNKQRPTMPNNNQ